MLNNSLVPFTRYLMLDKILRNSTTYSAFKQSVRFHGRNPSLDKPVQYSPVNGPKIFGKVPNTSKKQENSFRYSGSQSQRRQLKLMNIPVVLNLSFYETLKVAYFKHIGLKKFDESFVMDEFLENSVFALQVVSSLLSELRFDELEGLLTDECRKEVEKNLITFGPTERMDLVVKCEDVFSSVPCRIDVIKDEKNNRTFFEITVIHNIVKNMSQIFKNFSFQELFNIPRLHVSVYNCRFIKEVTKGVEDNWIINAINFFKLY